MGLLLFSKETLTELNEVFIRSKFDRYVSINERVEYMERLEARSKVIEVVSAFDDCRDKKDNKFLNLAYDGKATYIVTGDDDLLVLNPFHKIQILSSTQFFNEVIV